MPYNLDLLPEAKQGLDDILYYYDIVNSELKQKFAQDYAILIDRICENPFQFSSYHEKYRKARIIGTFDTYHIVFIIYSKN